MFIKLAWRNLWRHRRRTLITMGAVVFAIFIITLSRSLQYGSYDALESSAIQMLEGDMQLAKVDYHEDRNINDAFPTAHIPHDLFAGHPEIEAWAPRISGFGLISSDTSSTGTAVFGIDPEKEAQVTRFSTKLKVGEPLSASDQGATLLGQSLAKQLDVGIGDEVVVITQGYRNAMGAEVYQIKGLVSLGSAEMDRAIMIINLADANNLFVTENAATQVAIKLTDFHRADQVAAELDSRLGDHNLDLHSWREIMPDLEQMIAWDNVSGAILLSFLIVVVGFEILNTATMSVVERRREFGILQAIGMKRGQLAKVLAAEFLLKVIMAVGLGILVSAIALAIIKPHPLPLSQELKDAMALWGEMPDIYFSTKPKVFLQPLISVGLVCLLAVGYPIALAVSKEPIDSMRQG